MATSGPKSDKIWSDAVRLAAMREAKDKHGEIRKRINIIADNLVRAALDGDMDAIKEMGNRIDGKPHQALHHSGEDGGPLTIQIVKYADDPPS